MKLSIRNLNNIHSRDPHLGQALDDLLKHISELKSQVQKSGASSTAASAETSSPVTMDTIAPGANYSKTVAWGQTDGLVDFTKPTVGTLPSTKAAPSLQVNSTNYATVDSVDAGTDATIRIYGTGGVGTGWSRIVGTVTQGPYPAASLTHLSYATTYWVMYDGSQYYTVTSLPSTLADDLMYVGTVKTVSAGGTGGTSGGGGSTGGTGGVPYGKAGL